MGKEESNKTETIYPLFHIIYKKQPAPGLDLFTLWFFVAYPTFYLYMAGYVLLCTILSLLDRIYNIHIWSFIYWLMLYFVQYYLLILSLHFWVIYNLHMKGGHTLLILCNLPTGFGIGVQRLQWYASPGAWEGGKAPHQ